MDPRFAEAVEWFERGELGAAERLLQQVMSGRPDDFDALHLLGVVKGSVGDLDAAVRALRCAVDLNPEHAFAQANLAKTLVDARRPLDALPHYQAAVRQAPQFREAWIGLGAVLHSAKRFDEALAAFDQALALDSTDAQLCSSRGAALLALERLDEAMEAQRSAVKIDPHYTAAWYNLGLVLAAQRRYGEALAAYDRALQTDARCVPAWCDRGAALHETGHHPEALASYDRALAIDPQYAPALLNRGVTLDRLWRFEEAVASFERALDVWPDCAEAWFNRAVGLGELGRYSDAIASCDRALQCGPGYFDALRARGMLRLLTGDMASGWADYESRWKRRDAPKRRHEHLPPMEDVSTIRGKSVLVWAEQGTGDTLQFCRYAPLLSEKGARVVLEVQPPLKSLLESLRGVEVVSREEPAPDCDLQVPLMSLPYLFGTTLDCVPCRVPYLVADPESVASWRTRIAGDSRRLNVGLACSGSDVNGNDWKRSIPLSLFRPLARVVNLWIVQKDLRPSDRAELWASLSIRYLGDEIVDFADSAAIVENLDLVISVDSALAHLAGALGKEVWLLLPWTPEWRWLLERTDSPWYPTARLFRQSRPNDWLEVIDRVAAALAHVERHEAA